MVMVATSNSHTRYRITAIAVCGAALWFVGDARASASSPESASEPLPETGDYVEEVIVTADRLEKGAMPTQTIVVQTYSVLRRGKRLYNERKYKQALPYLLIAGKRGFKWAQAMAGDIYVHGRGGVPRAIEEGMGWLGVAARPQTAAGSRPTFAGRSPRCRRSRKTASRRRFVATARSGAVGTGGWRVGERSRHRRRAWV